MGCSAGVERQRVGSILSPTSILSVSQFSPGIKYLSSERRLSKSHGISFIHFNDIYHINPQSKEPVGGAARFVSAVKMFRKQLDSCVFFSGDTFNPSLLSTVTRGRHMVPILKSLNITAACYGNHDFDFGIDHLTKLSSSCGCVWVMTNIIDERSGLPIAGAVKSHIIEKNGVLIGIIGLAEMEWFITIHKLPPWVKYIDKIQAAREEILNLRNRGADIIVVLSHMREKNDIELANNVPVDIILSGHDHFYKVMDCGRTKIINSGTDFRDLSLITLTPGGVHAEVNVEQITITKEFEEDLEIKEVVDMYEAELVEKLRKPVCITSRELDVRTSVIRSEESAIGNMVADILKQEWDSDCAIMNSGALRADIVYAPGHITIKDILDIIPIEDTAVVVTIKGSYLKEALENGLSKYPTLEGRFPIISGIKLVFDGDLPPGQRITKLSISNEPFEAGRIYKLCTTHYLLCGGDGYDALKNYISLVVNEETGHIVPVMVRQYLINQVSPENRVERKSSKASIQSNKSMDEITKKTSINNIKRSLLPIISPKVDGRLQMSFCDAKSVVSDECVSPSMKRISSSSPIPISHTISKLMSKSYLGESRKSLPFKAMTSCTSIMTRSLNCDALDICSMAYEGDKSNVLSITQLYPKLLNQEQILRGTIFGFNLPEHMALPLHHAIAGGKSEMVHQLIQVHRADPNKRSGMGCNAREFAFGLLITAMSNSDESKVKIYKEIIDIIDTSEAMKYLDSTRDRDDLIG